MDFYDNLEFLEACGGISHLQTECVCWLYGS